MSTAHSTSTANVKDALSHLRAAAQELHRAISDAAAKQGGATKADLDAFAQKARSVSQSLKSTINTQTGMARKALTDAAKELEASEKKAGDAAKASGQELQRSIREAVGGVRASVQKISDAVAAARSASSGQK